MIISDVNIFLGGRQTFQRTFNSQQDQFQANRQYSHDPTQHYRNEKPVYQASVSYTDFQTHEYTRETGTDYFEARESRGYYCSLLCNVVLVITTKQNDSLH